MIDKTMIILLLTIVISAIGCCYCGYKIYKDFESEINLFFNRRNDNE